MIILGSLKKKYTVNVLENISKKKDFLNFFFEKRSFFVLF